MIAIAGQIIEQLEGDFDPETFTDRYEEALRELIQAKETGTKPAAPPEIMEALKRKLGAAPPARRKPDP